MSRFLRISEDKTLAKREVLYASNVLGNVATLLGGKLLCRHCYIIDKQGGDIVITQQSLFTFMKDVSKELYELAVNIEEQLYVNPDTTLMKSRLYCEELIKLVSKQEGIEEVYALRNAERIHKLFRDNAIEEKTYMKLEWVRKKGNKAAHKINTASLQDVLKAHKFLYEISVWYMQIYVSYNFKPPIYDVPKRGSLPQPSDDMDILLKPYIEETQKKIDSLSKEIKGELNDLKSQRNRIFASNDNDFNNDLKTQKKPFPILEYISEKGLKYIDNRDKNGALWVLGDWSVNEKLFPLKKHKIYFRYTKKGGRATKYKPAWFMLNKTIPLIDVPAQKIEQPGKITTQDLKPKFYLQSVQDTYWKEKGQILLPKYLESISIQEYPELTKILNCHDLEVRKFSDITEKVLRNIYKYYRFNFYRLMELLYILGFRFAGKLASYQITSSNQNDQLIKIEKGTDVTLNIVFPQHYIQRLEQYQIKSLIDLDNMLISSIAWILNEKQENVTGIIEGKIMNLSQLTDMPKDSSKISNQNLNNGIKKESHENITLFYKEQLFVIDAHLKNRRLTKLDIKGCNHLLNRLSQQKITKISDLPRRLDQLHTRLHGVGPRTVEKFWEQLTQITDGVIESEGDINVIVYQGKQIDIPDEVLDEKLRPNDFSRSKNVIRKIMESGINTVGELALQFHKVPKLRGVGTVAIGYLLNEMEIMIQEKLKEIKLNNMSRHERYNYELQSFISWYKKIKCSKRSMRKYRIPDRYLELIERRFQASLKGQHLTLEFLGKQEGVTRERIRQILKKGDDRVAELWTTISLILKEKLFKSKIILMDKIDNTKEEFFLLLHALESVGIFHYKINNISVLSEKDVHQLDHYVDCIHNAVDEFFKRQVIFKSDLESFCKDRSSTDSVPIQVIFSIASEKVNWLTEEQGVLTNMTKADVAEIVMLQYFNGVEAYKNEKELIDKANDIMPGAFSGERSFNSIITRDDLQDTFALWGRGIYIHRKFITKDKDWVHSVQKIADEWLENEEFIHVAKLYEKVKSEAQKRKVPNEYALYTLMRYYDKGILSFPRFPSILPYGADRIENREWIVNFINEINRPVSINELVEEFVEKKGWKRFTLDYNLFGDDEIIPYSHGHYVLLKSYDSVDKQQLELISQRINRELDKNPVFYIRSFFKENNMYLESIGIPTSYVLYYLLKNIKRHSMHFPRFPYIVSENFRGDSLASRELVEEYLLEERRIVAREEVINFLEEKIGVGSSVLDLALVRSNDIFYFSYGQYGEYVHRETIGMDDAMVYSVNKEVEYYYNFIKRSEGREYVLLKELYHPDDLPNLPNYIPWSVDLLGDILKKHNKWTIIGSFGEIILSKKSDILNEVDFIQYILQHHFSGAVKIIELRNLLKEIRYSADGEFLVDIREALKNKSAPFSVIGDELIDNDLNRSV